VENIEKYAKERDEMLLKGSVAELKKFIAKYEEYYNPMMVDALARAKDEVLEITLHKMIIHCVNLPFDYRQKSADWLLDRGYSLDLGGANG
jgi:hypothetical protein